MTLLTFRVLWVICRRRWRRVRPGSLRWSSSSSNSRSSSWRGWKMPQPGPSWENLSMCCLPSWLSFWFLSQLWLIVWSHWWRHARVPSRPSSSSFSWPSCGETGMLSRGTHTVLCSPQDDQIEDSSLLTPGNVTVAAVLQEVWRMWLLLGWLCGRALKIQLSTFGRSPEPRERGKKQSPVENANFYSWRMRLFTFWSELLLSLTQCSVVLFLSFRV